MKRSSFNTRFHHQDAEKTKSTYQRPANDEGYIEFENFSRRLSIKTKPYDAERIPSSHRLTYSTDNCVSTNQRPANDEGYIEFETFSRRLSMKTKPYDPERIPSSHQMTYLPNNQVSTYQRPANDEGNFEYEALSGKESVISEFHNPEEIPSSHRWPYSTSNRVSTYQRSANDEGNFEHEALSGRQSVITEPHDPKEILSEHRWPYSTKNYVSTCERPANDEENFEYDALLGRQSIKIEPHDPSETSTSHPLPYLTHNHFPNFLFLPIVGPPPIMMKVSPKFEADLERMIKKFGQIKSKKIGIFIKLCPETYDLHRKLISFLETNNIQYKTPRKIRVFITGLPCHMSPQQIKNALTEKGFDVEGIIQVTEHCTKKPLPLFQVVLPNSNRNQNIVYLTNLLNLDISVGNVRNGQLQRHYIKYSKKDMVKAGVPKWVNFIRTPETISWDGSEKYSCNNNFSGTETTCANTSRTKRRRNRRYFH